MGYILLGIVAVIAIVCGLFWKAVCGIYFFFRNFFLELLGENFRFRNTVTTLCAFIITVVIVAMILGLFA